MAYPIQPTITQNYVTVKIYNKDTNSYTDISNYVTSVSGFVGSEQDNYYTTLVPGNLRLELYDTKTIIDSGLLKTGYGIYIENAIPPFIGSKYSLGEWKIVNVLNEYVRDKNNNYIYRSTLEGEDAVSAAANTVIPDYALITSTSETMSLSSLRTRFGTIPGWPSYSGQPNATINQFVTGGTFLEIGERVARGCGMSFRVASQGMNYWGFGLYRFQLIPTSSSTINWFLTDGTHTSVPSGGIYTILGQVDYTDIQYGYRTDQALSSCTFNNYGLDSAPASTTDTNAYDIIVPYESTQSIGYTNKAEFDATVATNNLGWNICEHDGTGKTDPSSWTAGTNYSISATVPATMTLNGHKVKRIRATGSQAGGSVTCYFSSLDPDREYVTNSPGTATGSYVATAKCRGVGATRNLRMRISFLNSDGDVVSAYEGSTTACGTGSWTTVSHSVPSAPPGSVSYVISLVNADAAVKGNSYYVSEIYAGRSSTSSTWFNGNTADDASNVYTWVGTPFESQSQKNTNNIKTYTDAVLARNTVRSTAKQVTINATQAMGLSDFFTMTMNGFTKFGFGPGVAVCVNGVTKNYEACGMRFEITPTTVEATLNLASY